ncbi:hypothetical protein ONE63_007621 [Megalurothrips usitatus]|uniref:Serine/arginine repetitive matrix protein 1 n=1 Tax=Megalurothrips usitatus TaxID=439358 RepID=A0AAV7XN94_9NEOP|nr:hypothetical protein ONE63_007621 [Megalurothrips usitatus]
MSRYDRSPRSRSSQSTRLRMDSYSSSGNGRSAPRGKSPKRNELNNVMRKARQDNSKPSIYWNKKLLEAEEKDPNRWRHSGYKELYADGSPSNPRRSRSRSRSRSHLRARSKSRSRSARSKSRSNSPRGGLGGGLAGRDRIRSPPLPARPSPPPRLRASRDRDRERERERERERDRDRERDRERERQRERERERERDRLREPIRKPERRSRPRRPQTPEPPPPKPGRRPEPIDIRKKGGLGRGSPVRPPSASGSSRSVSSCSDSVCSVCLPKSNGGKKATTPPMQSRRHTPPGRRTPPPRRIASSPTTIPRRPVVSPPPTDPRGPPPSPPPAARRAAKAKRRAEREKAKLKGMSKRRRAAAGLAMVKLEGVPRHHSPPLPDSASDSCSTSSRSSLGAPRLTLSERFGKMAQWSENRRDLDGVRNMRITRESEGTDFKEDLAPYRPLSPMGPMGPMGPMPVSDRRVGLGYFPEALHAAPVGLEAWDDVRVRYQYYKERGYLRDLSLDDYVKWEEWWYKYQEWLEAERYYEQWHAMRGHLGRGGRRGKRNRI